NTKRMLAYSSIAHTGYILAAVAATAAGPSAGAAVLFYVFAYGVMNLGAFACLLYIDLEGTRGATLDELNGFARREPFRALALAGGLRARGGRARHRAELDLPVGARRRLARLALAARRGGDVFGERTQTDAVAQLVDLRFVRQRCGDERAIAFDQLRPIALRP